MLLPAEFPLAIAAPAMLPEEMLLPDFPPSESASCNTCEVPRDGDSWLDNEPFDDGAAGSEAEWDRVFGS